MRRRGRWSVTRERAGAQAKPEAAFRISSQLSIIPGKDLPEKLANMDKWGFDAVELPGDAADYW